MLPKTQSQNNLFFSKIMAFTVVFLFPSAALAETIGVSGITFNNTTTPIINSIHLAPSNGSQGSTISLIASPSQTGSTSQTVSGGTTGVTSVVAGGSFGSQTITLSKPLSTTACSDGACIINAVPTPVSAPAAEPTPAPVTTNITESDPPAPVDTQSITPVPVVQVTNKTVESKQETPAPAVETQPVAPALPPGPVENTVKPVRAAAPKITAPKIKKPLQKNPTIKLMPANAALRTPTLAPSPEAPVPPTPTPTTKPAKSFWQKLLSLF